MDQVEGHLRGGIEVKLVALHERDEILRADKVFETSFVFDQRIDWRADKSVEIFICNIAVFVVKEASVRIREAFSTLIVTSRVFCHGLELVESYTFASDLRFFNELKSGSELLMRFELS